ncbi:MAG: phosphoglucosamine mutase [Bacilli bacterium]|nr:phosphoglucosamine mutase [Bacilli bacterium]
MGKYFGTDGVRGIANDKLTSRLAYRIGRFLGQYPNGKKTKILIGRDTRLSGTLLDCALISGVTTSGGDVYELGVTTTPSISYLVENGDYDFGVMISASHNPFFDNGIKIFSPNGEKCPAEIEAEIEKYIDSEHDYLPMPKNANLGRLVIAQYETEKYLNYVSSKASGDYSKIKALIDCANGSASVTAKKVFVERLGLNADIIFDKFDGTNINNNCGSTHLENLKKKVKKGSYNIGIAFDGDADRCLLVDEDGNEIDGDMIMYINAMYLKKVGKLKDNKIVITVMSNLGLKKLLEQKGLSYEEVSVGDKYVQAKLKEKHLSLGGEQSGHVIFNEDLNTGDGMLTAIRTLNVIAAENASLKQLNADFVKYPQVLQNVGVSNKEAIMENEDLKSRIQQLEESLNGDGRILVRPSGTEQLVRVMVEAKDISTCKEIAGELVSFINELSY